MPDTVGVEHCDGYRLKLGRCVPSIEFSAEPLAGEAELHAEATGELLANDALGDALRSSVLLEERDGEVDGVEESDGRTVGSVAVAHCDCPEPEGDRLGDWDDDCVIVASEKVAR